MLQGLSALHLAVRLGHTCVIRTLLRAGASPMVTDPDGLMPIHAAAHFGRLAAARLLLDEAPQTATSVCSQGSTPMHLAAGAGHLELVRLLLEAALEAAMMKDADGCVPLYTAAREGHAGTVRGRHRNLAALSAICSIWEQPPLAQC